MAEFAQRVLSRPLPDVRRELFVPQIEERIFRAIRIVQSQPADDQLIKPQPTLAPPPPTVTSITPNAGSPAGGTSVQISGSNFLPGATASIGGVPLTSVVVVNGGLLQGVTGPHAEGSTSATVVNPTGQSGTGGTFLYQGPPDFYEWISSGPPLSPWGFGPSSGGNQKVITFRAWRGGVPYTSYQGKIAIQIVSIGPNISFNFGLAQPWTLSGGLFSVEMFAFLNLPPPTTVQTLILKVVDVAFPSVASESPSIGVGNG